MQPPPPPGSAPVPPPAPPRSGVPPVVGLLLAIPAGLACLAGYAWPTVRTFWNSLHRGGIIREREWVGLDNYQAIADSDRPLGYGLALSSAWLPLLVLLLVAPLLAWAIHRAGRPVRLLARLALVLPMVCLAPAAFAVATRLHLAESALRAGEQTGLGDPARAPWLLRMMIFLTLFGLVCAVGIMLYLAVMRVSPGRSPWPALLTVDGLAIAATLAVALQSFTYPFLYSGGTGGPAGATVTPMLSLYQQGFARFELGVAAGEAVLLSIPLLLLGLGAVLLVALTGLRVELAPEPTFPRRSPGAIVAAVLGLVAVLAVTGYGLWPWLSRLGRLGPVDGAGEAVGLVARSWLPPLVSVVVGVGLAAVAGFGIGGLRPLGRWSELLLLPFAPWLFVGIGPLSLVKFEFWAEVGLTNTLFGLIPPVWLVVPALVVFTVLFRGLAAQRLPYRRMVLLGLPMVGLVGGATWLVQSQALLWPSLAGTSPDYWTAPVWLRVMLDSYGQTSFQDAGVGLVLALPMIVFFAGALVLLQLFYLDRLAIRVGREDRT